MASRSSVGRERVTDPKELHRRAGEIFAEAIELAPVARDVFLDEACEGDAGLRARVERLIELDDDDSAIGATSSGVGTVSYTHLTLPTKVTV